MAKSARAAGWGNVLTRNELIQSAESRYQLYELDARARSAIKAIWPAIAPHVDKAIDVILDAAERLPLISDIVRQNRDLLRRLEASHFEALLNGDLDANYFESCRKTVLREAALGLDAPLSQHGGKLSAA